MVHKYRVYQDPFPHPALNKLLALVVRAMAIAQLTQLHIIIPASGSEGGGGAVPEECFPSVPLPRVSAVPGCFPGIRSFARSGASGPTGYSDSRPGLSAGSRGGSHERFY